MPRSDLPTVTDPMLTMEAPGLASRCGTARRGSSKTDGKVQGLLELLHPDVLKRVPMITAPGAVHENVQPAELRHRSIDDLWEPLKVVDVRHARQGPPAARI
jgi:hypothetical protein